MTSLSERVSRIRRVNDTHRVNGIREINVLLEFKASIYFTRSNHTYKGNSIKITAYLQIRGTYKKTKGLPSTAYVHAGHAAGRVVLFYLLVMGFTHSKEWAFKLTSTPSPRLLRSYR
ncbi:hypothetical protein D3C77_541830 [compost metagenome]